MPWCPKCKLEYVEGVKICPDCKSAMVDELPKDEADLEEEYYDDNKYEDDDEYEDEENEPAEDIAADPIKVELIKSLKAKGIPDDQIQDVLTILAERSKHSNAVYKPISEKYNENKSGASILLIFGFAGIVTLILNLVGVIHLPLSGSSLYLTYIVMGTLFLIFFISGITSIMNIKKLAPQVTEEEENIKEFVAYLKSEYAKGSFEINIPDISEDEKTLIVSQKAVQACEDEFPNAAPGFSFYVVDRYYEEIFETVDSEISSDDGPAEDEANAESSSDNE